MSIKKTVLRVLLVGIPLLIFTGCQSDADQKNDERIQKAKSMDVTKIEFEEKEYDFGTTNSGTKVKHTFKFKNTGDNPLFIANAEASCGCTVPSYPEKPIAPGASADIDVVYKAMGLGDVSKSVTISANTVPSNSKLIIKGKLTKKEE